MELTKTGFKQTEVGSIPEDWKVVVLSEVTDLITDGAHLSPPSSIYGYPIATVENINKGYIDIESCRIISKKDYEYLVRNNCKPVKGDVLLSKDGTIGITFTLKDNHELVLLSSIALIRPNDNQLDSNYLSYSFKSEWFYTFLNRVKGGSALKRIVLRDINKFIFPLPPTLTEQKAIATALSDVDSLISSLDKLISKKKSIKQGAMQELLTPPHKGGSRLAGFSGDWEEKKIGKIGITYGGLTGKTKKDFENGQYPYITFLNVMKNIIIDTSIFEYVNLKSGEVQNKTKVGDLFFNTSSETPEEVGMCALLNKDIEHLYLNSFCFGYRLKEESGVHGLFFSYLINSFIGRNLFLSLAQGATRYNLSKSNFNKLVICVPGIEEQKDISTLLSDMDLEIKSLENKKAKYQEIKQGMMQELLTGKTRLI